MLADGKYSPICNIWEAPSNPACLSSPLNTKRQTKLIQWGYNNEKGQQFTFVPSTISPGYYLIKNKYGLCVDVFLNDENEDNGASLGVRPCGPIYRADQLWKFVEM